MYQRIKDLREDHDYKQKQVAERLNISQPCYSYYEIGRRDIPANVLIELAKIYNTSVDYILGVTDVKQPYKPNKAHK